MCFRSLHALLLHTPRVGSKCGTQVPTVQKLALDFLWSDEEQQYSSQSREAHVSGTTHCLSLGTPAAGDRQSDTTTATLPAPPDSSSTGTPLHSGATTGSRAAPGTGGGQPAAVAAAAGGAPHPAWARPAL